MSSLAEETKVEKPKKEKPKKEKKGGAIKVILVILVLFIIIPGLVLTGFYFLNETFKYRMNTALSEAPGSIGTYFESIPTRAERNVHIQSIAEYYLKISENSAVDKLLLLNNDEPGMYDSVIKKMLQMDPNDTKIILQEIREQQRQGDAVSNTLDEIIEERNSELALVAEDLQNIPFTSLRDEMYKILNDGLNGSSQLAKILEQMEPVKAFELLSMLDESDKNDVLDSMTELTKIKIREEMNKDLSNNQKLISISEIYKTKDASELEDLLGSIGEYTLEELAVIFKELGIIKTARILSLVTDDQFINNVIAEMKNNEVLENDVDLITKDILKALKIYKDFDDNILQLASIYSAMESSEVATILKGFFINGSLPQVYVLDSGDIIEISDEKLGLRVLRTFDDKKIAEILSYFDTSLSTVISRKLTVPEY